MASETPKAPVARNVPKRADSDVKPTDYTPSVKVAPEPAIPSGIGDAPKPRDLEPEIADVIRKPSVSTTKRAVDTVREASSRVTSAIRTITETSGKPLNEAQRFKGVDDGHKRRSRAAKRYRSTVRGTLLAPAIRMGLRSQGIEGASRELVDTIIAEACKEKTFAGFKVSKRGTIEHHELTLDYLIAYTLGSHALGLEDYLVDASLKYPTLFDCLVFAIAIGSFVDTLATSPVIKAAIDRHIAAKAVAQESVEASQAEATITDARSIVEENETHGNTDP